MTVVYTVPRVPQTANLEPFKAPGWFPWERFKTQRNTFPHLLVCARSGAGKSVLTQWLTEELRESNEKVIAVAPHWKIGDCPDADVIIGSGRHMGVDARPWKETELKNGDVKTEGEPEVSFSRDVLTGKRVTICQFLNALLREMNERYELVDGNYRCDVEDRPSLSISLDEMPAYGSLPGVGDVIKKLIREARKVRIRLIILAQGSEVKTLGMEGEGSLRDNLTFIRLTDWAREHAYAQLQKHRAGSQGWKFWANVISVFDMEDGKGIKVYRAAMVDEVPALIPDLSSFAARKAQEARKVLTGVETPKLLEAGTEATAAPTQETEKETPQTVEPVPSVASAPVLPPEPVEQLPPVNLAPNSDRLAVFRLLQAFIGSRSPVVSMVSTDELTLLSIAVYAGSVSPALALTYFEPIDGVGDAYTLGRLQDLSRKGLLDYPTGGTFKLSRAAYYMLTDGLEPSTEPQAPTPNPEAQEPAQVPAEPTAPLPVPDLGVSSVEESISAKQVDAVILKEARPGKALKASDVQKRTKGIKADYIRERFKALTLQGLGGLTGEGTQLKFIIHS